MAAMALWRRTSRAWLGVAIVTGLLLVPVQCSAVAGPHSMFVDAQNLATLEGDAAGDLFAQPHVHHDGMMMPMFGDSLGIESGNVEHHDRQSRETTSMAALPEDAPQTETLAFPSPLPAGMASGAVVVLALTDDSATIADSGVFTAIGRETESPHQRWLTGPEPPPG